jgi:hypothetical protein
LRIVMDPREPAATTSLAQVRASEMETPKAP